MGRPVDLEMLLERARNLGGTAAIVGPHGSGKSTLLVRLAETLVRPVAWAAIRQAVPGSTVCIDSWECISRPVRGLLRLAASVSGCGLLVTSHRAGEMPVLMRCSTNPVLLRSIVRSLPGHELWQGTLICSADIEESFARHGGNLRESLYELYDRFEGRARHIRAIGGSGQDDRDDRDDRQCGIHESEDGISYVGAPERNLG
jgi:energy-coupling factor transporter ATP-binding protein EcfA2